MTKAIGLLLTAVIAAQAAPPAIREVYPRGAQRGKSLTVYLRGEGLVRGARVQSTLPATFSQLTLSRDPLSEFGAAMQPGTGLQETVLPFLVTLKPDAPVGLYPIRVFTPDGLSNIMLFSVGDLPEVEEAEWKSPKQANNFAGEAQKIAVPAVINGTLDGPDIDSYVFAAKAGQKLVFEVEARRAGSAIDPAIEIFDATGRELARNDDAPGLDTDARVEVAFAKAGEYRVQIHDSKFSDQSVNFYRLKIGSYPYADAVFPLGWRRGETAEVTLSGGNLPQPVKVKADLSGKASLVAVRLPGSASLPMWLAAGDSPEILEPDSAGAELPPDTVVNGRIAKPGEIDRYKLRVEPGQKWVFEVMAASLGTSQLDGLLTISDAAGKKLVFGDDGNGVDPVLPFTVPKDVNEITVALEDLLGRGGPAYGYRLLAKQQEPDFAVELLTPFVNVPAGGTAQVACLIRRRGYDGEMKLRIPNLPAGFQQSGGHVASEAAAQIFNNDNAGRRTARSVITITADADAKPQSMELTVIAEAKMPSGLMTREARGPGLTTTVRGDRQKTVTAPWLDMKLPMATSSALPVTLEAPTLVRVSQGFEYTLSYRVRKKEGAKTVGKVNIQQASTVGNIRILKGEASKTPDAGAYLINTNFATPFATLDMILETQAEIDGKTVTISSPTIEMEIVPGYQVRLEKTALEIAPGSRAEVAGTVRREPTFEGAEIRVVAEDLPEGVKCEAVEVPADKREFTLRCEAGAAAKPGSFNIRIASVAPNTGRKAKADYKIADIGAKLVVETGKAASAQGTN